MSDLKLDVDQAGELKAAFRRGDWSNDEIKKLCEGNILTKVRDVVRGNADIVTKQHVIDLDANPFVPYDWKVAEHIRGGQFLYDPVKIVLYLSTGQKKGSVNGYELRKELLSKPVYNAILLDYYLAHPELIPEEWKGKYIYFWGTIYSESDGRLCVRCLYSDGSRWHWDYYWVNQCWNDRYPVALAC